MAETLMQTNKPKPTNPLSNYFRQPKLYIPLPSKGQFYPEGALDVSSNGEYAVYAMTAKDELMFKTPDALLNGSATTELVKSCVPAIKDAWAMPSIDIDAVLIAIRIATYGDSMEVGSSCPMCNHQNDYDVNLLNYLEHVSKFEYNNTVDVDPLIISIRPYSYQEVTKAAIKAMEQQKIINIVNDETMSDEEKMEKFGTSFVKLTEMTVDVIAGCITSIETPEGIVTDSEMIKEFINNAPTDVFNKVNEQISAMKNSIDVKAQEVACTECEHKFNITIVMDQTNFFAVRS
jgi:hypothetical protein